MALLRDPLLLVAGGALGTLARYYVGLALNRPEFPWGTVAVNAAGSFLMGFFMVGVFLHGHAAEPWRLLLAVGFLGGFTTMSTFAYESIGLFVDGNAGKALLHLAANPLLSILSAALGWACGRLVPT